jgi:2-keto-4-pentenoate hydratase/2-oxohepta-3-ene-1,7-dioic acid hydratase in catechol pathway
MRLVTFSDASGTRIGALDAAGEAVIDFAAVRDLPTEMAAFVAAGRPALDAARRAIAEAKGRLPLGSVKLLAPFSRPRKNIFCVGKNYHEHAKEFHNSGFDASAGAAATPDVPIIFTKPPTSVIGPGEPIPSRLDPTRSLDYEGELTVVIGPGGRGIAKKDAFRHVYGYTIINDATARTLQQKHRQWFLGKSIDGFCPMGPWLLTADEVPDVGALRLETRVNGETRQDAVVSDLIFDIPTLIETISAGITLEPGDLIATGTPAGVGVFRDPKVLLKDGDEVTVEIAGLGALTNPVKKES